VPPGRSAALIGWSSFSLSLSPLLRGESKMPVENMLAWMIGNASLS
jgi:hypothetical protein